MKSGPLTKEIKRYYSAKEVLRLTDVTYRRLDSWVRSGIIHPSVVGARCRRLFSFNDVIEIRTLKALTANGVKLAALVKCVARLRRELGQKGEHALASTRLITDGKTIFRYLPQEERLESLDEFGQFAFAFGLGEEISSLRQKAANLDHRFRYARKKPPFSEGVQTDNALERGDLILKQHKEV